MARNEAIENLQEILLKRRDALRKALDGDLSLLQELNRQSTGDSVDVALDSAQDEISSQLAEVESRELASIENALVRMKDGQYGLCEGCEQPIPMVRLQALPYATYCIQCKTELETTGELSGSTGDWDKIIDSSADSAGIEMDLS